MLAKVDESIGLMHVIGIVSWPEGSTGLCGDGMLEFKVSVKGMSAILITRYYNTLDNKKHVMLIV